MTTDDEPFEDWTIRPYDDQNFDSVSMQQSTCIDSDYVANQVWMHELKRALDSDELEGSASKAVNVQIQVVSNATVSPSKPQTEVIATGNHEKEKTKFNAKKYFFKLTSLYVLITLILIAVVIVTVLLVGNKSNENANGNSNSATQRTEIFERPKLIKRADSGNETSKSYTGNPVFKVKRLIIMDSRSDTCRNATDCENFIKSRKKVLYGDPLGIPEKMDRENFFIAPDGTVYEGCGFIPGKHTFDRQQTAYNLDALGVSFIGNYTSSNLTIQQEASLLTFIRGGIDFDRISPSYILYHQMQLTLDPNADENLLFRNMQNWDHWRSS